MKNNILLILAVTIISIGIIVATVLISTSGGSSSDESSSQVSVSDKDSSSRVDESTKASTTEHPTDEADTSPADTESSVPVIFPDDESSGSSAPYDSAAADGIIATARSLIGVDFMDGGDSPEYGFDNSGFVYYVLRENGYITCPRELAAQSEMGTALAYDELRPGDLAYFYADDMATVGFGGIYCGDGIMIACLMPGTQVKEINITTPYYTGHFYRGISLT